MCKCEISTLASMFIYPALLVSLAPVLSVKVTIFWPRDYRRTLLLFLMHLVSLFKPHVGPGVWRTDRMHFLAGWHERPQTRL